MSGMHENKKHKENGFTSNLLPEKKPHMNTIRTFKCMAKITRSNGCHWEKRFSLFCRRLMLSDWVVETFADEAKTKFGVFFSSWLRKTVPFARCHQKITMCLKGWKKPEGWQAALLPWPEERVGAGALGRSSDDKLAHRTFEDKLCSLHKKKAVCPAPAGFTFVDLFSMQHFNIICLSLGMC